MPDELPAADAALAAAVLSLGSQNPRRTRAEAAAETGLPEAVIDALARERLLRPTPDGSLGDDDVEALRAGAVLLDAGLPLAEVLDLARRLDQVMRVFAPVVVEAFLRFVRDPVHAAAASETESAERLVTAFTRMLPATQQLVAHHIRQVLLEAAVERLTAETGQ